MARRRTVAQEFVDRVSSLPAKGTISKRPLTITKAKREWSPTRRRVLRYHQVGMTLTTTFAQNPSHRVAWAIRRALLPYRIADITVMDAEGRVLAVLDGLTREIKWPPPLPCLCGLSPCPPPRRSMRLPPRLRPITAI